MCFLISGISLLWWPTRQTTDLSLPRIHVCKIIDHASTMHSYLFRSRPVTLSQVPPPPFYLLPFHPLFLLPSCIHYSCFLLCLFTRVRAISIADSFFREGRGRGVVPYQPLCCIRNPPCSPISPSPPPPSSPPFLPFYTILLTFSLSCLEIMEIETKDYEWKMDAGGIKKISLNPVTGYCTVYAFLIIFFSKVDLKSGTGWHRVLQEGVTEWPRLVRCAIRRCRVV